MINFPDIKNHLSEVFYLIAKHRIVCQAFILKTTQKKKVFQGEKKAVAGIERKSFFYLKSITIKEELLYPCSKVIYKLVYILL